MIKYKKERPSTHEDEKGMTLDPVTIEHFLGEIIWDLETKMLETEGLKDCEGFKKDFLRMYDYVRRSWDLIDEESYEYRSDNEQRKKIKDVCNISPDGEHNYKEECRYCEKEK